MRCFTDEGPPTLERRNSDTNKAWQVGVYAKDLFPSAEQVRKMAQLVSQSLFDPRNMQAKGGRMFRRRQVIHVDNLNGLMTLVICVIICSRWELEALVLVMCASVMLNFCLTVFVPECFFALLSILIYTKRNAMRWLSPGALRIPRF